MIKIDGLDDLTRELEEAQRALASVEGELGSVNFNPNEPESIEAAIQKVEAMIDERLGAYASNPIVGPLADQMKRSYRDGIIDHAAEARLKNDVER